MPDHRAPVGAHRPAQRVPGAPTGMRQWDLWRLPGPLRCYVIVVPTAATAAIGLAAVTTQWRDRDLLLFMAIVAAGSIVTWAIRDVQVPHGTLSRDMFAVWFLAAAVLLPPVYALLTPIPLTVARHWVMKSGVIHRRVFSAAACGLAYAGTSVAFHALPAGLVGDAPGGGVHILTWTAALAVCGATGLTVNNAFVLGALRLTEHVARLRELVWNREAIFTDLVQLSYGFAIAVPVALNPFLLPATVPIVLVQRRFMMHAQLLAQARIDAKTGLLNATTWQREAAVELTRAVRTHTPLALAMVDVDHFKLVNDTFGHLAGDLVLRELAGTLKSCLRAYDVIGRFGGEEFTILLPQTDPGEAERIAGRLCDRVASHVIVIDDDSREGFPLRITVSIGVAAISGSHRDLGDLMAAADHALYQAKKAGRNRVHALTDGSAKPRRVRCSDAGLDG